MTPYTPPAHKKTAFNCPMCGAYASQTWYWTVTSDGQRTGDFIQDDQAVECGHCHKYSLWRSEQLIYPSLSTAPLANPDMPADVFEDYEEARNVLPVSPRGAAALLRLAIQKLCKHLGEKGKNINDDIASLVQKGLPQKLQQALDSVRVVGNNAVHPGQIDLKDDKEIANKLFAFINIICDNQITQPKTIDEFYNTKLPEKDRQNIQERDAK